MKNLISFLFLLFAMTSKEQISLSSSLIGLDRNYEAINITRLSNSGYKYYRRDVTNSKLIIYNLDFSVYKNINIPITLHSPKIFAVSEDLFDTNNSNIEFLVTDYNLIGSYYKPTVTIIDELGNIIFQRDSCTVFSNGISLNDPENNKSFIVSTTTGVKMILTKFYPSTEICDQFVYDLPGQLTCQECTSGIISSIQNPLNSNPNNEIGLKVFPNPSNERTMIVYFLPNSQTSATIIIYSNTGKELKKYNVDNFMNKLELKNSDFTIGLNLIKIITKDNQSRTEKWLNAK